MIFTDEEMRYIKCELGLLINFTKPSIMDLMCIIAEAGAESGNTGIRDRVISKAEKKLSDLYDKENKS